MSAASLQAKVKKLLGKANVLAGSPSSVPIYQVTTTQTGTPLNPASTENTPILLPKAVFKSYDKETTDVNIKTGDRELVSDSDNEIVQGNTIRQGAIDYLVVAVDKVAPISETLVYLSQCRQQ